MSDREIERLYEVIEETKRDLEDRLIDTQVQFLKLWDYVDGIMEYLDIEPRVTVRMEDKGYVNDAPE